MQRDSPELRQRPESETSRQKNLRLGRAQCRSGQAPPTAGREQRLRQAAPTGARPRLDGKSGGEVRRIHQSYSSARAER